MKGSTFKRCTCPEGRKCPRLRGRRHGTWGFDRRVLTSTGVRTLRRSGYETQTTAEAVLERAADLIRLAGGDKRTEARIGDMIFAQSRRGGELPAVEDVRRRLGLRRDLAVSETTAEWLETWYAGKRAKRDSVKRSYRMHLDTWLIPQLGEVPLDRLNSEHIAAMLDQIEVFNAEIRGAAAQGRAPVLDGDVRSRPRITGPETQRRIVATLRNALNEAVRQRRITWNPCSGIELPETAERDTVVWSPAQVGAFLEYADENGHRLALLYRLILLCGLRRGEAIGARWDNLDAGHLTITQTVLQLGGRVVYGKPKTKAGKRKISIPPGIDAMLAKHRDAQRLERWALGEAYEDNGLIFCRKEGSVLHPEAVSRQFKALAVAVGLPPIKLHEGRHTAASLALEASLDVKVVSAALGHSGRRSPGTSTSMCGSRLPTKPPRPWSRWSPGAARAHRRLGRDRPRPFCVHTGPHPALCVHPGERHSDVLPGQRRAWDSNPRARSPLLAVFKTAAIGH